MAKPDQLNLYELPSWGSRGVECFEKLEQIGEGTYGQVFMAKEKATGEIVALKRIRMDNEKEGFPITAIREIKILKKLHHDNIINLKEIVTSKVPDEDEKAKQATLQDQAKQGNLHDPAKQNNTQDQAKPDDKNIYKGSIYMVFEYMDHDLTGLSDRPGMRFSIPQVKCYMKQLLTGLHYCHINQVLHRDIKGSNLLIDNNGNLKLADFGLARSFSGDQNAVLTNRVITLWYRPPELLLGSMKYGPAVDMWSVGCIFAELLQGKPILTGKNEAEQISRIYNLCGSAEESSWPGVSKLPHYHKFKPQRVMKRRVAEQFKNFERHALELVEKMLTMDPSKRITAKDALDAEYFWTDPLPCSPRSLPKYEASHEYQTKKKRQQQRQQQEEMAKRQKTNQYQQPNGRAPPMQNPQGHLPMRPGPGQPHNPLPNSYPAGPPGGASRHPPGGGRMGHGGQAGYPNRGGQGGTYGGPPQQGSYAGPPMNNQGRGYGMGNMGNYPQGPYVGGGGGRGRGMAGNNRGQQFGPPNAPPMPQVPYGNQPYMQPQQYGDMDPAYPRSSHTGY